MTTTLDIKCPKTGLPRLGFSITEFASMTGRNYSSIYRLVKRGKIRANLDLKTPTIPLTELHRFLNVEG